MALPQRTDQNVSIQASPVRDGIHNKSSIAGHTLIVGGDMSIWDDTSSAWVSQFTSTDIQNA